MNSYGIQIQIPTGRVQEIMDELTAAQETIRRCYDELVMLGVVTIVEKTTICIGDGVTRQWLIETRNAAKMSQQAVADAAGISQSYYAGIETGVRGKPLAVPVAKAIANVLGFDWAMFYEDDAQNEN